MDIPTASYLLVQDTDDHTRIMQVFPADAIGRAALMEKFRTPDAQIIQIPAGEHIDPAFFCEVKEWLQPYSNNLTRRIQ